MEAGGDFLKGQPTAVPATEEKNGGISPDNQKTLQKGVLPEESASPENVPLPTESASLEGEDSVTCIGDEANHEQCVFPPSQLTVTLFSIWRTSS